MFVALYGRCYFPENTVGHNFDYLVLNAVQSVLFAFFSNHFCGTASSSDLNMRSWIRLLLLSLLCPPRDTDYLAKNMTVL